MSVNSIFSVSNAVSMISRALNFLNANPPPGEPHSSDDYEHEEFQQTFNLTPGDRVEVSRISGPVEVESTDGDVAEVHIIRSARIKTDLVWRKIRVEQTPTGLVIEPVDDEALRPRSARVNHYVLLRLPRRISFTSAAVSGSVNIGRVEGTVQISGTSGSVIMKETNGPIDISGVSGSVILNLTRLDERGLRVSGVSGTVQLYVSDNLNAHVSITDLTGQIVIDIPQAPQPEARTANYHCRLGQGGARISVSGVTGNVVLRRG
jgi:hypothetical protein